MRHTFIIILMSFTLTYSCRNNSTRNIINVTNIEKKLHKGMLKSNVLTKFGIPKDSTISDVHQVLGIYDLEYDTNDFTGYTLKIWFDEDNKVKRYRID